MEEDDRTPQSIAICPPDEPPNADTDKDSDLSDEEVEGNINHLPRRILRSEAVVRYDDDIHEQETEPEPEERDLEPEEPDNGPSTSAPRNKRNAPKCRNYNKVQPNPKKKKDDIKWFANMTEANSKVPKIVPIVHPNAEDLLKETVKSPFEAMQTFFSRYILEHLLLETNRYASQKLVHNFNVSEHEMLTFIGVLLLSGYHPLPYRRLYWASEPDVHCDLVSNAIRRNRFDAIMSNIHLANNETNDGSDKLYKVRQLFDMLNLSFKQISPGPTVSIDESIIPYYGRHGLKQFIKGKPIRFGFKLWVAADPSGNILHAEPYCGTSTNLPTTGLGQGGDVVLGLVDHIEARPGTQFYFDNLFTSVGLLQELSAKKIGGTGTLRENRCNPQMKLPDKKAFKKTPRGSVSSSGTDNIVAVRWNDNSVVTVLSNCDNMYPMKKTSRYSRIEKSKIPVEIPQLIHHYNLHMGGVDIADQFVASYRCRIRSKKWWWPLFAWSIDISCVQGWLLYRRLGHNIPLLNFRRECAIFLLKSFGESRKVPGVRSSMQYSPALEEIRKDGKDHFVEKAASKYRRCKVCGKRSSYFCVKCNIALHPENCFVTFHNVK